MRKYPTSSLHCQDYRRSAHGLFGTRESDRRFLALAARRLGASDGSLVLVRMGLHAPRFAGTFEPSEPGNKLMANYMAQMGAPKEMIDLALQTDLAGVNYVDHAQLRHWGLVNSPACPHSRPLNSGRRSGSVAPR